MSFHSREGPRALGFRGTEMAVPGAAGRAAGDRFVGTECWLGETGRSWRQRRRPLHSRVTAPGTAEPRRQLSPREVPCSVCFTSTHRYKAKAASSPTTWFTISSALSPDLC